MSRHPKNVQIRYISTYFDDNKLQGIFDYKSYRIFWFAFNLSQFSFFLRYNFNRILNILHNSDQTSPHQLHWSRFRLGYLIIFITRPIRVSQLISASMTLDILRRAQVQVLNL